MSSQQPLPPKKEVALALLERSSVHLHLDPRVDGVVVPPWFKKQHQLVLQIGLNMPVPIPDLRLDDDGMSCTLSFNRSPFYCVVPWSSIFAMVGDDMRGMVWPEDMPPEVAKQAAARPAPEPAAARKEAPKPALREVPPPSAKPKRTRKKAQPRAAKGATPEMPPPSSLPATAPMPTPRAMPAPALAPTDGDAPTSAPLTPATPRPAAQQHGRKPKRELPPYLRVVK